MKNYRNAEYGWAGCLGYMAIELAKGLQANPKDWSYEAFAMGAKICAKGTGRMFGQYENCWDNYVRLTQCGEKVPAITELFKGICILYNIRIKVSVHDAPLSGLICALQELTRLRIDALLSELSVKDTEDKVSAEWVNLFGFSPELAVSMVAPKKLAAGQKQLFAELLKQYEGNGMFDNQNVWWAKVAACIKLAEQLPEHKSKFAQLLYELTK